MTFDAFADAAQFVPLLSLILLILLELIPVARILRRAGFRRIWCIIAVLPMVNVVGLWMFALRRWPALLTRIPLKSQTER